MSFIDVFRTTLALLFLSLTSLEATTSLCGEDLLAGRRLKSFEAWARQPANVPRRAYPSGDLYKLPVLVIGAGPAGLAAMRELSEAAIPFEAVERQSDVGGLWNPANPLSPAYDALRTNSSKATTYLGENDPMPRHWPDFLSRDLAHEYLKNFSALHDLRRHIRFRTEVINSAKLLSGAWQVMFGDGRIGTYRALIIASGTHNKNSRYLPDTLVNEAQAAGIETMHASDYREPSPFAGKSVLVVGIGNTGSEVATGVSRVAEKTYISVRTTPWIVPEYVLGQPADAFAKSSLPVPHWFEMWAFHRLQRYYVGHPKSLGFPEVNHDLLERLPIVDLGIVRAIREKRIEILGPVVRFERGMVGLLHPFSRKKIDVAIFATGYRAHYPFLPPEYQTLQNELSLWMFHPREENLIYMFELGVPQGVWPVFAQQAKAAVSYLRAQVANTSHYARFQLLRQTPNPDFKGHLFRKADSTFVDPKIYADSMLPQFSDWIEDRSFVSP